MTINDDTSQHAVQQSRTPDTNSGHTDTEFSMLEDPVSKLGSTLPTKITT